jgi:hypothetical protein
MGNLNKTTAEVEALLNKASDSALAPYLIKSFDLQMLTSISGEVGVMRQDRYGNLISDAIREGRRVLIAVGHTSNGYQGWVDTNAYQEDLIYIDFYHMEHLYHIEISNSSAMYTKLYIGDYVRDIAATVVEESMPTEIATATQRRVVNEGEMILRLSPNILYDYGAQSLNSLSLPSLSNGDAAYDNKWMVKFALISSDNLTIPFDVFWKDGIAPSWSEWCVCQITFFKDSTGVYTYGEWKIYK